MSRHPALDEAFTRLAGSPFRSGLRLGRHEAQYLADRGMSVVLAHAAEFIARRLAAAAPANDGRQTPMRGHPVFIAQHATATCCRGCLAKWHGIPAGRLLDDGDRRYILSALERWLADAGGPSVRLPVQLSLF